MSLYAYTNFDMSNYEKWGMQQNKRVELKDKPSKRSEMWKMSNESKVPMLSDHLHQKKGKKNPLYSRDDKMTGKSKHDINNLFHESHLQK